MPFEEMDSSLNVQQWIQQVCYSKPWNSDFVVTGPKAAGYGHTGERVNSMINSLEFEFQCLPQKAAVLTTLTFFLRKNYTVLQCSLALN